MNLFLKVRRLLSSGKWILLLTTTSLFFLCAASGCPLPFTVTVNPNGGGPGPGGGSPQASQTSTTTIPQTVVVIPSPADSPVAQTSPVTQTSPVPPPPTPTDTAPPPAPTDTAPPPTGKGITIMIITTKDMTTYPNGFTFSPVTMTIKKGTKVTWVNNTAVAHNVLSDDGKFGTAQAPLFGKGKSYSFVFSTAGTFSYHCGPHPDMIAKIIVQ